MQTISDLLQEFLDFLWIVQPITRCRNLRLQPRKDYAADWKETTIKGDLGDLAGADAKKIEPEKIAIRMVSDKETGAALNPDPNSPLLIIGDSHTLVFHDFLAEKSGLLDQVAYEIGFALI